MSICVLMSVYNGAKYIEEQLKSIEYQEADSSVEVLIRDDGSTDKTLEIIKKFSDKSNLKITVYQGENRGPSGSFLELISRAPNADLYAFCDQDDVWLPGKLKAAEEALKALLIPALWASNYDVTDEKLDLIEKEALQEPERNQFKALFYNNVPGCTMVFNRALIHELRKMGIRKFRMHDILTLCVALVSGQVIYDKQSYILYRQHSLNTVGKYSKKIRPLRWIKEKVGIVFSDISFHYSSYAKKMLEIYENILDEKMKEEYRLIGAYKNGFNRFRLLKKPYTKGKGGRTSKSIRMRILLGKI